jgi:hypothetical protein
LSNPNGGCIKMPTKVGSKSETSLNSEEKEEPETSNLHP